MHSRSIYFLFVFSLTCLFGFSQYSACDVSPFPCKKDNISYAQNENARLKNFLNFPEELRMEFRCRSAAEDALKAFTGARHWSYYEVDESADQPRPVDCDDPRAAISKKALGYDPGQLCGIKYVLRPPHDHEITYIVVVNEDSLSMWNKWRRDTILKETQSVGQEMSDELNKASENPKLKALSDSLDFYIKSSTEFNSKYLSQYRKDLAVDNKKGMKVYEDKNNFFQKKADFFRDRYEAEVERARSAAPINNFFYKNAVKDGRYIEGSVLLITFRFNASMSYSPDERSPAGEAYQRVTYVTAGAEHAFLLHAKQFPVEQEASTYNFEEPSCIANALLGAWVGQGKSNPHYYVAAYSINPSAVDNVHLKKTHCDVVQTMEIVVKGRIDFVTQCLRGLNLAQIFSTVRQ